jgi:signal transduction histidine kinase
MSRHRLHRRIYVSLLAVALLSMAGTALLTHALVDHGFQSPHIDRLVAEARFVARTLEEVPDDRLQSEVDRLGSGLGLHLTVLDAEAHPLASTWSRLPPIPAFALTRVARGVPNIHVRTVLIGLDRGRTLAVWARGGSPSLVFILCVLFGLLALGCVFVARRLTRRLEALEQGVAQLGSGRLETRVQVEGHDEIARLAERFNWSAERIERLIESQRRMLLSASHELRSPLARVRMALELIRDRGGPEVANRVADATVDIDELDALVDDLLLASRIETEHELTATEALDLSPVVTEEGARAGARVDVAATPVVGDPRLLRRLVRNLLDNAVRHGGGSEIEAGVAPLGATGGARLWVADRGPGVAESERERIFEPFYRGARTAPDASGVGVGLSLVRQIAERHGGAAVCRPRDGGGAIFEVTIPAHTA